MAGWGFMFIFITGVVIIAKIAQWFEEREGQKRLDAWHAEQEAIQKEVDEKFDDRNRRHQNDQPR